MRFIERLRNWGAQEEAAQQMGPESMPAQELVIAGDEVPALQRYEDPRIDATSLIIERNIGSLATMDANDGRMTEMLAGARGHSQQFGAAAHEGVRSMGTAASRFAEQLKLVEESRATVTANARLHEVRLATHMANSEELLRIHEYIALSTAFTTSQALDARGDQILARNTIDALRERQYGLEAAKYNIEIQMDLRGRNRKKAEADVARILEEQALLAQQIKEYEERTATADVSEDDSATVQAEWEGREDRYNPDVVNEALGRLESYMSSAAAPTTTYRVPPYMNKMKSLEQRAASVTRNLSAQEDAHEASLRDHQKQEEAIAAVLERIGEHDGNMLELKELQDTLDSAERKKIHFYGAFFVSLLERVIEEGSILQEEGAAIRGDWEGVAAYYDALTAQPIPEPSLLREVTLGVGTDFDYGREKMTELVDTPAMQELMGEPGAKEELLANLRRSFFEDHALERGEIPEDAGNRYPDFQQD